MYSDYDFVDFNNSTPIYNNPIYLENLNEKPVEEWVTFAPALLLKTQLHEVLTCGNPAAKLTDAGLREKAAAKGDMDLIQILNKYQNNLWNEPALYNALRNGDFAAVKTLIENDAQVEYLTSNNAVLSIALNEQNIRKIPLEFVAHLISNGASVNYPPLYTDSPWTYGQRSALCFAALGNRIDIIELLLKNKADPNQIFHPGPIFVTGDFYPETVLSLIAGNPAKNISYDKYKIAKLLLENGANPNLCDALFFAASAANASKHQADMDTLKLLVKFGGNPHQEHVHRDVSGITSRTIPYNLFCNNKAIRDIFDGKAT